MCTLTFVPGLPGGGYLLSVNRDESPGRGTAAPPAVQRFGSRQVLAPRDPDAGGSWIGVDDSGHCIAILNGDRPLPLGQMKIEEGTLISRGLLVHDLLEDPRFNSVSDELERRHRLDALHYKPFKLMVVSPGPSHGTGRPAHTLRADWDGLLLRMEEERGPRCTVSSTFETEAVTNFRRAAFDRFLHEQARAIENAGAVDPTTLESTQAELAAASAASLARIDKLASALGAFHASHHVEEPQGGPRSVCMHREDARTVSHTLVLVTANEVVMRYRAGWPCQGGAVHVTSLKRVS
ncbi:MAG TPA: NRDE family protein [Planctomycetota bacterium]|nr:NRDE family protein [Planctomycetota bacterium]